MLRDAHFSVICSVSDRDFNKGKDMSSMWGLTKIVVEGERAKDVYDLCVVLERVRCFKFLGT